MPFFLSNDEVAEYLSIPVVKNLLSNKQIMNQLKAGHILIVYDPAEESCSILRKESLPKL